MDDHRAKLASLPSAAFFDCRDSERLSHESPAEAVLDWLDSNHDPTKQLEDHVAELCPVTLKAYARDAVTPRWFKEATNAAINALVASFDDYYRTDDDDGDRTCRKEVQAQHAEVEAMVRRVFAKVEPWGCHEVGSVTLEADDVLALVRIHAPQWLTPTAEPGGVATDGDAVRP